MMQVERVLKGLKADESIASDIRSVVCQILRHYPVMGWITSARDFSRIITLLQ
jgi:hypothetical protein